MVSSGVSIFSGGPTLGSSDCCVATPAAVLIPFLRHGTRPFLWPLRGFGGRCVPCWPKFPMNKTTRNTMSVSSSFRFSIRMFGRLANRGLRPEAWDGGTPWQVPSQGCPNGCNIRTENILATQPCEDQPRGDVWKEFRDGCSIDPACLHPPMATPCWMELDGASLVN